MKLLIEKVHNKSVDVVRNGLHIKIQRGHKISCESLNQWSCYNADEM